MTKTLAPLASLLLGISFLLSGNSLLGTVLPLRGLSEHFSPIVIGLMGSSYNAGFVLGCLACPFLIQRAGHIRAYSTLVSLAAATTLIHPIIVDPTVWILARAITGFSLAGLYLIVESWLNDKASNENRGLVMSIYIVVNFSMTTVGQLMVLLAPIQHFELFAAASILVSLAVVPVALTTSAQPAPIAIVEFRPLRLFKIAPVGLMGTFMIGVANGAYWSLLPVFAIARGLTSNGAAVFLSIAAIGGALAQWPIGRLSDRLDRRLVLGVGMIGATVMSLLVGFLPLSPNALLAISFVLGAAVLTGYSVAAAHAYDRCSRSEYVEMATGVLLANGTGAIIGPLIASYGMEAWGETILFVHMAVIYTLLGLFIAVRWFLRAPPAADEKDKFDLGATAPVGTVIVPVSPRPEASDEAATDKAAPSPAN